MVGVLSCAITNPVKLSGDAVFYHEASNLLAKGHGWINPYMYRLGDVVQTADHPPLYTLYLAAFSLVGLNSVGAHQAASILLCAATIPFVASATRRVFGSRAAVVASIVACANPGIWSYSKLLLSESMAIVCVAAMVAGALRVRDKVKTGHVTRLDLALLGLAIAAAILARAELLLGGGIIACLAVLGRDWKRAAYRLGIVAIVSAVLISPWVLFNLSRFNQPVFISDGAGITLSSTNCERTYNGDLVGAWSLKCSVRALRQYVARGSQPTVGPTPKCDFWYDCYLTFLNRNPDTDYSDLMKGLGSVGRSYINDHLGDQPRLVGFRLARAFGFYKIEQQLYMDQLDNSRGPTVSRSMLYFYYSLLPLAVIGAMVVRKQRRALLLLLTPVVTAGIAIAITYGSTRYRAAAEVTFVILGAVGFDWLIQQVGRALAIKERAVINGPDFT